jgi:hypothetical protein
MSKAQWIKENLKPGEEYAGLLLGKDGQPDQHIILLPGDPDSVTWKQAKDFAKKQGGELPTRREQSLLFANLKEHFKGDWYWSGEQRASYSYCAWGQDFGYGTQDFDHLDFRCRARAVRRLVLL